MLSKLYVVKRDCHILEKSLKSVKFFMCIKKIFGKCLFLCIRLTSILYPQFYWIDLKTPPTITQQTLPELIVYHFSIPSRNIPTDTEKSNKRPVSLNSQC